MVDAVRLIEQIDRKDSWLEPLTSMAEETRKWCVRVKDGDPEIKVTLAWDDDAPCVPRPPTSSVLVNDLDLSLRSPSGTPLLPWTRIPLVPRDNLDDSGHDPIDPAQIVAAKRDEDHLNNVEMVSVNDPEGGYWEIVVSTKALDMGEVQAYSLVSSHDLLDACPEVEEHVESLSSASDLPEAPSGGSIWARLPCQCNRPFGIRSLRPVPSGVFVPFEKICQNLNCPECVGGKGWEDCPGWWVRFRDVPRGAVLTIIDQHGKVVAEKPGPSTRRYLRIEGKKPSDRLYVAFRNEEGRDFSEPVVLDVQVTALEKRQPVKTVNRMFVPEPGMSRALASMLEDESEDPLPAIVTLMDIPDSEEREALLRSGISLKEHLGGAAYHAELLRRMWKGEVRSWARDGDSFRIELRFHEYVSTQRAEEIFETLGVQDATLHRGAWHAVVPEQLVREIAAYPTVKWIRPTSRPTWDLSDEP
jgi:hypothetical protein